MKYPSECAILHGIQSDERIIIMKKEIKITFIIIILKERYVGKYAVVTFEVCTRGFFGTYPSPTLESIKVGFLRRLPTLSRFDSQISFSNNKN